MKKALVAVIIVHGIFLTFLLKFNFWLFDSMSRTFTPLSFAALELYGKILSGMGISWWLLRRGINRNFKEAYQHPILYSIITMLCISILGIVTVPIASFAQNMLVKQIVRSSTYEDRADALLSFAATTTMVYPHAGMQTEFSTWTKFKYLFKHEFVRPVSDGVPDYAKFQWLSREQQQGILLQHAQSCRRETGLIQTILPWILLSSHSYPIKPSRMKPKSSPSCPLICNALPATTISIYTNTIRGFCPL